MHLRFFCYSMSVCLVYKNLVWLVLGMLVWIMEHVSVCELECFLDAVLLAR